MRWLLALLVGLGVLVSSVAADACKCQPMSLEREFELTSHVFEAEVIGVSESREPGEGPVAFVHVVHSWKGAREDSSGFEVHGGARTCGFPITTNGRYLVFASQASDGSVETNSCSRTRAWADAQGDVAALGALGALGARVPAPPPPPPPGPTIAPARGACARCSTSGSEGGGGGGGRGGGVPVEPIVLTIGVVLMRRRRDRER